MTLGSTSRRRRRRREVHKLLDAYVEWRDACVAVQVAYGSWRARHGSDRALAFYEYEHALDREERAANVYARLVRAFGDVAHAHPAAPRAEVSASRGG